ncbi:hypothetical protein EBU71_09740 [bacterium]|nr:hypothetical protein [Candidatus Elulimicrobium humile]
MKNLKLFDHFFFGNADVGNKDKVEKKPQTQPGLTHQNPTPNYAGVFKKWAVSEEQRNKIEKIFREILFSSVGEEFKDWVLVYYHNLGRFSVIMPPVENTKENELLAKQVLKILEGYAGPGKVAISSVNWDGFSIDYIPHYTKI